MPWGTDVKHSKMEARGSPLHAPAFCTSPTNAASSNDGSSPPNTTLNLIPLCLCPLAHKSPFPNHYSVQVAPARSAQVVWSTYSTETFAAGKASGHSDLQYTT